MRRYAPILVSALAFLLSVAHLEATGCDASCLGDGCTFRGLQNSALGAATLSIDPSCRLLIQGIGGSGNDGVLQTGLASSYMKTTLGTPNFSESILGTSVDIRQLGVVDDDQGQEIMLTRIVNFSGTDIKHSISCSEILVEGYKIWIYNGSEFVAFRELGVDPPVLQYPKVDILWIACGIRPNGNAYTVFRLGSAQSISLLTPPDPGPFEGDLVFVEAFAPQKIPTQQNAIENTFFATGTMTIASMEAGALPGQGPPCSSPANASKLVSFSTVAWEAVGNCATLGKPTCPAPCLPFPTLEESGLEPACYGLASSHVDELAALALQDSWGEDRCPLAPASSCDDARQEVVRQLILGGAPLDQPADIFAFCQTELSVGCDNGFCAAMSRNVSLLLGAACLPVRHFSGQVVAEPRTIKACKLLEVADLQIQGPGGDATFIAGSGVIFANGLEVGSHGAKLAVVIDSSLTPAPTFPPLAGVEVWPDEEVARGDLHPFPVSSADAHRPTVVGEIR